MPSKSHDGKAIAAVCICLVAISRLEMHGFDSTGFPWRTARGFSLLEWLKRNSRAFDPILALKETAGQDFKSEERTLAMYIISSRALYLEVACFSGYQL